MGKNRVEAQAVDELTGGYDGESPHVYADLIAGGRDL